MPRRRAIGLTILGGFLLVIAALATVWFTTNIPDPNQEAVSESSVVMFAGDRVQLGRIGATNRISVPLDKVPPHVRDAVLAAEDRNFYHEWGISPTGIARAVWVDVRGGDVAQGGSTITQQYAKVTYLSQERTLTRKLHEIVIAMKLDRELSKDKVLENYLNTIYFGRGTYGIQAASRAYFGKDVSQLTPAEGAVLAAQIQLPSHDPTDPDHQAAAKARWRYVVTGMTKLPSPSTPLTPVEASTMTYPDIKAVRPSVGGPNGFVVEAVHDELLRHGFSEDQINLGGLHIITTIDVTAQRAAITAENQVFNAIVPGRGDNPPVSALVSVRPGDGAVVAMYGGKNFGAGGCAEGVSCLNLATKAMAQPGSSFKPYVLAAALREGTVTLRSRMDGPPKIHVDGYGSNNQVTNAGGESCYGCTMVKALAESINTIFVPLAAKVGPRTVAQVAHSAGIPDDVPLHEPGEPNSVGVGIGLGIYDVHPIDQAVGYATFAASGVSAQPYLVRSVTTPGGDRLYESKKRLHRVLSQKVADDVTYAMEHVVTDGTGTAAQLADGQPAAGKTGTTQDNTNAWFVGFSPPGDHQVATAVWVGHAKAVAPLTDIEGFKTGVFGGTLPAQIFKNFADTVLAGAPVGQFPPPSTGGDLPSRPTRTATSTPSATPSTTAPASPTTTATPTATVSPSVVPSVEPSQQPTTAEPTATEPVQPSAEPTATDQSPAALLPRRAGAGGRAGARVGAAPWAP